MKVAILGGGPSGLYCGLLLKKANPRHDITVIERNPPDATYGWGVVFSERTLGEFRDADPKTAQAITDRFVQWDVIDVHFGGKVMRCGGQGFAGIARTALLNILQRRCEELGVALRFRSEIGDLSPLAGPDVIVAADGVNSAIRKIYARTFKPRFEAGKARYVWYGTTRLLEAFTFVFKENAHGLFQVHAYPFDGTTSTWIIECAEDVWQRAGLDRMREAESIAYCERLFADELHGARLMSNNSKWINFVTVKNARWSHRNIVLIGDAAHTAHFSIGSGTKLAMEDAIALARAFERRGAVTGAFNDYEATRRPAVETFQQAAAESRIYFENIRRYLHMQPRQFAFHLLTRSGRVTHDRLRLQDPFFLDAVDGESPMVIGLPPLHKEIVLSTGFALRNRVVLACPPVEAAAEGRPSDRHRDTLGIRARTGAGLVLTEPVAVAPEGRITPFCPGLYTDAHVEAWRAALEIINRQNWIGRIGVVLNHAGRRGAARARRDGLDRPLRDGAWPLLSASALPYTPHSQVPKAMDRSDMDAVRDAFTRAARMAGQIGFGLLVLHCGHGYLLASFISPLANRREDEYGGPLENRMRFPLEVLDAVRAVWPRAQPIAVALTAADHARGGASLKDGVAAARMLCDHGADLIHVLAGHTVPGAHPPYGRGFLTAASDVIRNEARVPTMVGGHLVTADEVNTILAAGRADLCIMHAAQLEKPE